MIELLKNIPNSFLVLIIVVLAYVCTLMLKRSFSQLTVSLNDFKRLIEKLFEKHEDHESRLSRLEGEHFRNHKG